MTSTRLGILGGTFDPVHFGHLDAADAASAALTLDEIALVPAHDQPLRVAEPRATAYHRFALAVLAVADRAEYSVSDMELLRQGRSYTEHTLRAMHASGWRESQLFFILGTDAFAGIAAWHGYPAFLDLAHFVVIARPGTSIEDATLRTPELRARMSPAGSEHVGLGGATRIFLVQAHTRDVSSTTIRERLAAGQSIHDLVPATVARHIYKHHLYGAVGSLHGEDERI
jgi:nicotinate-nucleotide adenylyltransferase